MVLSLYDLFSLSVGRSCDYSTVHGSGDRCHSPGLYGFNRMLFLPTGARESPDGFKEAKHLYCKQFMGHPHAENERVASRVLV